ncbi:MAG: helix-turn-helix domain-containing protein [Bryobacteraceae bacterium]|jgi:HTH-type transcriptional regulator/antitoxin HigA
MDKTLTAKRTVRRPGTAPARVTATLNALRYGRLCAAVIPKVIENDREFDRMTEELERLTFKRNATTEENVLAKLIERLIQDYDDTHHPLPAVPPNQAVRMLMEQRRLRQADLVQAIGSRAQVSDLVSGRRGISKAQAKRLAEFFHVPADLFI